MTRPYIRHKPDSEDRRFSNIRYSTPDPTQSEIEAATAAIRARWNSTQLRSRSAHQTSRVEITEIFSSDLEPIDSADL